MDKNELALYYHPDELFDRPYEKKILYCDEYTSFPDYSFFTMYEKGIIINFNDRIKLKIEIYNEHIVRFSVCNGNLISNQIQKLKLINEDKKIYNFEVSEDDDRLKLRNEHLTVIFSKKTLEINILDIAGKSLLETINGGLKFSNKDILYGGYRSLCFFKIRDENFFGFGGRTVHPNRTYSSADIFNIKAGVVSGDYGGCAVPFFLSTRGYGFFLNNSWPHVYFDMGKSYKNRWFFNTTGGDCDFFIIVGKDFKEILNRYTDITGRMPVPPKWLFGFWVSSLTIKKSEEVTAMAKRIRKEEYPCDGILIDAVWRVGPRFLEQYETGREYESNDLNWDHSFGNKDELLDILHKLNFKLGLHMNSRNYSEKTKDHGIKKNYLIKCKEETIVNFLSDKACQFYEQLIGDRIKEVDLWWIDHSDRVSGEIIKGLPCRNILGVLWSQFISDIMKREGKDNVLSLTRGSGIGGQKYGFPWPGDTANGIEHYEEDIWFCLNAGLGGFPIASVDIGGFNLKHLVYGKKYSEHYKNENDILSEVFDDDNIFRRVCQELFFIPVPRIHNNWCTKPKFPWNCNESSNILYKKFLEERYRLIPYIYSNAILASKSGEPLLRPLVYEYINDIDTYNIGDQFFFGESLLVAPITKKNVLFRKLYLPRGIWFYLWDKRVFKGKRFLKIEAQREVVSGLPIFIKNNSILVRQVLAQFIDNSIPNKLIFDVYMTKKAELILYESEFIENKFIIQLDKNKLHIFMENNTFCKRIYKLKLHYMKLIKLIDYYNCLDFHIKTNKNNEIDIKFDISEKSSISIILEVKLCIEGYL